MYTLNLSREIPATASIFLFGNHCTDRAAVEAEYVKSHVIFAQVADASGWIVSNGISVVLDANSLRNLQLEEIEELAKALVPAGSIKMIGTDEQIRKAQALLLIGASYTRTGNDLPSYATELALTASILDQVADNTETGVDVFALPETTAADRKMIVELLAYNNINLCLTSDQRLSLFTAALLASYK